MPADRLAHVPWPPGTRLRHRVSGLEVEVLNMSDEYDGYYRVQAAAGVRFWCGVGLVEESYLLVGDWPRPWEHEETSQ